MLPESSDSPLTTLTLFGIKSNRLYWALTQMGTSPAVLKTIPGLQFFKLLGSGKGGVFSLQPDFRRYGLFATWQNEAAAASFFQKSELTRVYYKNSFESWTVKLLPYKTHGYWDAVNPFPRLLPEPSPTQPIAVLTRAAINWRSLPAFWRNGRMTSKALAQADGVLAAIGLGELPFIRQATFSIWESQAHMQAYAYQNQVHRDVIQHTRAGNWYKEELFTRFIVASAEGTWHGINPLAGKLKA